MYESKREHLVSVPKFLKRLARSVLIGLFLIMNALGLGMWGYHSFEHMSWLDAFINASMILSGMGPVDHVTTTAGKLFAGLYALFSGLAFIAIIGIIFAPIVHRLIHKFNLGA